MNLIGNKTDFPLENVKDSSVFSNHGTKKKYVLTLQKYKIPFLTDTKQVFLDTSCNESIAEPIKHLNEFLCTKC